MGRIPSIVKILDVIDLAILGGMLCIVVGVGLRYDLPLALIVFGLLWLLAGVLALWRRA